MVAANTRILRKPARWLAALLAVCGVSVLLVAANFEKAESLLKVVTSWVGVGKAYDQLAVYDNFLLTASPESIVRFASGHGRSSLADIRIEFPDGTVYSLKDTPLEAAEKYSEVKRQIPGPQPGVKLNCFVHGFDSLCFDGTQLWGITLKGTSGIRIDFGNGEFVGLPVPREQVLEVLGPPVSWERTARGMP